MSLQFVAGPSGSGKSFQVYKRITEEAIRNPNARFLIVVPEQFSMQTQKDLAQMHPAHALLNIDVLSFNRLAYRVFEETGKNQAPILEDTGKILVLQKLISENAKELQVLGSLSGMRGAASRVNSQLSEFMQYRVEAGKIDRDNLPALLRQKLADLSLLSDRFSAYLQNRYLTAEEVPEVLSRVIDEYRPLAETTVVLDGFTGFVPTQMLVLEKLLRLSKDVVVILTADRRAALRGKSRPSNLFYMTHQTVEALLAAAAKTGTKVLPDCWVDPGKESRFGENPALAFLEAHLFRYETKQFEREQQSLFLLECRTAAGEIEAAAQTIANLVRTRGYRYRDFAFVTGNLEDYGETARQVFGQNGIPCFLDQKQGVLSNPAVSFVRAAVELMTDHFSYKSVFRFLKTGMTDLERDEICLLENYVLAFGVRGRKKYEKEWTRIGRTISEKELAQVNEIREKFVRMTEDFARAFGVRGASVRMRTKALYELAAAQALQKKCRDLERKFDAAGDPGRAREYAQIYKRIMDFLEKLVEILGEERVSAELYRQLLEAGFSEMKLGIIPPEQDSVVIGDIERTRLRQIRVMFFAGLNEGVVPKPVESTGVLSDADRAALLAKRVVLAPDAREEMYRQRLYLYRNLTKPSEELYLSWCRTGLSGEAMSPSYLVGVIRELFPRVPVVFPEEGKNPKQMETASGRRAFLLDGFMSLTEKEPAPDFLELVSACQKNGRDARWIQLMKRAALEQRPDTRIEAETAQSLFGVNERYSATRLETFAACGFRHFLNYALRLCEREEFEFSTAEIGTILHNCLRLFCERMGKSGWNTEEEAVDAAAEAAFREGYQTHAGALESPSRSFDARRIQSIVRVSARCIARQVRCGSFVPAVFEEPFAIEGAFGTVDRIDSCRAGDVLYLRVVDYKSQQKTPDLNALYYGTQLQLPLYMTAACELMAQRSGKAAEPAGIYYSTMDDPLVEVESLSREVTPEERAKKLRLSGISRKEPEVLMLMDGTLGPGVASEVIPVKFNKKPDEQGNLTTDAKSRVLSGEDFACLSRYTRFLLRALRRRIEGGDAAIDPKEIAGTDSCAWCPYASVCRFDERIPAYTKERHPKEDDETMLKAMAEAVKKEKAGNTEDDGSTVDAGSEKGH